MSHSLHVHLKLDPTSAINDEVRSIIDRVLNDNAQPLLSNELQNAVAENAATFVSGEELKTELINGQIFIGGQLYTAEKLAEAFETLKRGLEDPRFEYVDGEFRPRLHRFSDSPTPQENAFDAFREAASAHKAMSGV